MDPYNCLVAPCPKQRPVLQPTVPDVSLLMNVPPTNTYSEWKNKLQNLEQPVNPTSSIPKKHVRFNSPNNPIKCSDQLQSVFQNLNLTEANLENAKCSTPPMNRVFKTKQFQEIYMANIPNHHLDLSLLVQPVNQPLKSVDIEQNNYCKEKSIDEIPTPEEKIPMTYKEFLEMQNKQTSEFKIQEKCKVTTHECITDIYNYTSPQNRPAKKNELKNSRNTSILSEKPIDSHRPNLNGNSDSGRNTYSTSNINILSDILTERVGGSRKSTMGDECSLYGNKNSSPPQCQAKLYLQKFNQNVHHYSRPQISTKEKCDSAIQTSFAIVENNTQNIEKPKASTELARQDEPTVKDLLKIIQQQNEQLLVLQKQVASLLDRRERPKQIEGPAQMCNDGINNQFITNKEYGGNISSAGSTPRKGPLPKFSIDLMTSFEVSFRPQQNLFSRKQRDFQTQEPKIQEITETDGNEGDYDRQLEKRMTDTSLHLQEPINVREACPSPEPSIKINMKEYESSEDDEEETTSVIGPTFYKNLMDQVNKIIQNAQVESNIDGWPSKTGDLRDKTLNKVKDATIKHLKKIGVNFSTINEVPASYKSTNNEDNHTSEQISFAVKQLLMKYLPNDQLARLTQEKPAVVSKRNVAEKIVLDSRAPEFSFATVQFMKKYNLIAGEGGELPKKLPISNKVRQNKIFRGANENNPKILDISALKQQPKLL